MVEKFAEKTTELPKGDKIEFKVAGTTYVAVAKMGMKQADFHPVPKAPKTGDKNYAEKLEKWKDDCVAIAKDCAVVIYKKVPDGFAEVKQNENLLAKAGEKIKNEAEWKLEKKMLSAVPKLKEG